MQANQWLAKTLLAIFLASYCVFGHAKAAHRHHFSDNQIGLASYYSDKFHGRRTANGERYNKNALTAVHPHLPFGTVLRVTNLKNNKSVNVRVNDRNRSHRRSHRILDMSKQAAKELDFLKSGLAKVKIEIVRLGES